VLAGYLAPGAVEESADLLRVDDRYAASLAVVGYRREVGADWLAPLWRCGLPLRVAFHLEPLPDRTALARLERRQTRLEAAAALDARQGRTAKAAAAVALEDVLALTEAVERGAERLLTLSLYVTVEADSPARLGEHVRHLESVLGGLGLRSARLRFTQAAGYRASLPLGRDEPQRGHAMTAAAVAAAFPLAGGGDSGDGVVLGVDRDGGGLVELPLTGGPNRNLVVLGPSGGGKSYAVKAALLQARLRGVAVWVVDREGEYAALCRVASGATVRLAPGTAAGLNPLALPPAGVADEDDGPAPDALAERGATVTALLGLLLGADGGLTAHEEAVVDAAVRAAYAAAGVTADPATWQHPPTLADLQRRLAAGDGLARGLALRLAHHTDGASAGLFSASRRAPSGDEARLVRWDLRDLPEELTAAALLLLADAVWTQARRRQQDRLLVIDEAWRLIAHPAGGRYLSDLARRARKHALGLWVVSQDVRDLLEDRHGRAIAANAATALLLPQNERTIEPVVAAFGLGDGERALLLGAQTGEALLLAGGQRRAVRILVAPELDPLLTTDPARTRRAEGGEHVSA
jgi:type IV secretory pathway VirB4 component